MTLILEEAPAVPEAGEVVKAVWNSAEEKFLGYLRELRITGWWLLIGSKPNLRLQLPGTDSIHPGFYCPITAIYRQRSSKFCELAEWRCVVSFLGLPLALAEEIVAAADNQPGYRPELRQAILAIFTD